MFGSSTSKCYDCKETKLKTEFHKQKSKKQGINSYCKACSAKRHRYRKYGDCVNGSILDLLVRAETGCMICGEIKEKMCVDHCHQTNVIRGILCNACNVGIGSFNDDTTLLSSSIKYLNDHGEGYHF